MVDYKFIVLIVLILGLIYIVTTGFNSLKIQINSMQNLLLAKICTNIDDVKSKLDNNIGRCIKEIGESNTNFVEQIRKIDNIGGQKITCATENDDSESNKKSTGEHFSYFMSDVSHNKPAPIDNFKVNLLETDKKNNDSSDDDSTEVISVNNAEEKLGNKNSSISEKKNIKLV